MARLVGRGARHEGPPVGLQGHHLVVRQALQHLAHAGPADLEYLGQTLLHQLGAGRQAAVGDGPVNVVVHDGLGRRPVARDGNGGGVFVFSLGGS